MGLSGSISWILMRNVFLFRFLCHADTQCPHVTLCLVWKNQVSQWARDALRSYPVTQDLAIYKHETKPLCSFIEQALNQISLEPCNTHPCHQRVLFLSISLKFAVIFLYSTRKSHPPPSTLLSTKHEEILFVFPRTLKSTLIE